SPLRIEGQAKRRCRAEIVPSSAQRSAILPTCLPGPRGRLFEAFSGSPPLARPLASAACFAAVRSTVPTSEPDQLQPETRTRPARRSARDGAAESAWTCRRTRDTAAYLRRQRDDS